MFRVSLTLTFLNASLMSPHMFKLSSLQHLFHLPAAHLPSLARCMTPGRLPSARSRPVDRLAVHQQRGVAHLRLSRLLRRARLARHHRRHRGHALQMLLLRAGLPAPDADEAARTGQPRRPSAGGQGPGGGPRVRCRSCWVYLAGVTGLEKPVLR